MLGVARDNSIDSQVCSLTTVKSLSECVCFHCVFVFFFVFKKIFSGFPNFPEVHVIRRKILQCQVKLYTKDIYSYNYHEKNGIYSLNSIVVILLETINIALRLISCLDISFLFSR